MRFRPARWLKGVVVIVTPGGPADRAGIRPGEIVKMVNGAVPSDPDVAWGMVGFGVAGNIELTLRRPCQDARIQVALDKAEEMCTGARCRIWPEPDVRRRQGQIDRMRNWVIGCSWKKVLRAESLNGQGVRVSAG